MEVMEALKGRQSVKSYLPTPVEEEKLQKVLEAGRLAPSSYDRAGSGGSCAVRHA